MLRNSFIFLDRIGSKKERRLWKQGIHNWSDFIQKSSIKGIGDSRKEELDITLEKADKNLERSNRVFFNYQIPKKHHWRLYREFDSETAFIDIETTGLDFHRNSITTVSFYDGSESRTYIQGKNLTVENLQEEFDRHSVIATFNGKRFDIPFIKTEFPDINLEHPHIDLMYDCKKIGLSGGLKKIEKDVGIERKGDGKDVDGREAVRLWKRYQRGDESALETLVEYNRKDVRNLKPLMELVYRRLRNRCFPGKNRP